jgi:hypothetical protein
LVDLQRLPGAQQSAELTASRAAAARAEDDRAAATRAEAARAAAEEQVRLLQEELQAERRAAAAAATAAAADRVELAVAKELAQSLQAQQCTLKVTACVGGFVWKPSTTGKRSPLGACIASSGQ